MIGLKLLVYIKFKSVFLKFNKYLFQIGYMIGPFTGRQD